MPKELEQMRDSINGFDYVDDNDFAETIHCAMIETFDRCYEAMSKDYVKKEFMNNPWREGYRTAREEFEQSHVLLADVQILLDALKPLANIPVDDFRDSKPLDPDRTLMGWNEYLLKVGHVMSARKALEAFAARINIKV